LTENRLGKYMLYAIGEIFLVMIGILMALQVNNWNNERAGVKKEVKILKEFQRNLNANVNQFSSEIEKQQAILQDINTIMEQIKNNIPYHDSLGLKYASIAWTEEFNYVNSAFETLKTYGFDLISSDSIRESIIYLFNVEYVRISDVIEKVSQTEHYQLNALYLPHIEYDTDGKGIVNDSQRLNQDREFTNMLSNRRIWKIDIINTYKDLIEQSLKLSEMIERELVRREGG
jgi:Family of unknown function (DUF6090)